MNDDIATDTPPAPEPPAKPLDRTIGSSSIYRLCEEVIGLREKGSREHKMFEQALGKATRDLQTTFNSFAADTQRAYQQLRQEVHGEKRVSLALLNEVLDIHCDLERIVAARPPLDDKEAVARWVEAVEVEARKVAAAVQKHGIQPYDAVVGTPYNPAIHERVGTGKVEGMDGLRVAEQRERGYASQQPEFVLRRPKVVVTE